MFSAQYWYIGLLTLLVTVSQTFALLFLARHKWITRIILWCMAIFMLVFESVIFARNPDQMPIAFSTFTYFLFGIGVFVPWRPVRTTAAICSFVAGAIYMSGFLFRPELLTHGAALGMGYMQGFLLHDVLLMGGLLMLTQIRIKKIDAALVFAFVAFCVAYTEIAVHVYDTPSANTLFVGIIEATLITQVAPQFTVSWWWYILWYLFVAAAIWGAWELSCFINRKLAARSQAKDGWLVF